MLSTVERRPVIVTEMGNAQARVQSGLQDGERIVVQGTLFLNNMQEKR